MNVDMSKDAHNSHSDSDSLKDHVVWTSGDVTKGAHWSITPPVCAGRRQEQNPDTRVPRDLGFEVRVRLTLTLNPAP